MEQEKNKGDTKYSLTTLPAHLGHGFSHTAFPVLTTPARPSASWCRLSSSTDRGAMPVKTQETKPLHIPLVQKYFFGVRIGRAMPAICPTLSKFSPSSKVHPIDPEPARLRFTLPQRHACGCPWKTTDKGTGRTEKEQPGQAKDSEKRKRSEVAVRLWESRPERLQRDASKRHRTGSRPEASPPKPSLSTDRKG